MILRLVFALLLLSAAVDSAFAKRVALVMGNSEYTSFTPLPNPVNDARLMEKALREVGFEVTLVLNADQAQMKKAMLEFGRRLRKGVDASLFYYAGHGVQVNGENYLIPTSANIEDEDEVAIQAIDVNEFLRTMESAKSPFNIVVLDACRNNPLDATRGGRGGLAPVNAPRGSYIAYSTAPGAIALDGDGANSPYTLALTNALAQQGTKLEDVFKKAREQVLLSTDEKQVPWETSSLIGDFYFSDKSLAKPHIQEIIEAYIVDEYLIVPDNDRSASIAARYPAKVQYYRKQTSREKVIQDKLKWYSRWSSGRLTLAKGSIDVQKIGDNQYSVAFDASYNWVGKTNTPDDGKVLEGRVRVLLGVELLDNILKVFSEDSKLIQ